MALSGWHISPEAFPVDWQVMAWAIRLGQRGVVESTGPGPDGLGQSAVPLSLSFPMDAKKLTARSSEGLS